MKRKLLNRKYLIENSRYAKPRRYILPANRRIDHGRCNGYARNAAHGLRTAQQALPAGESSTRIGQEPRHDVRGTGQTGQSRHSQGNCGCARKIDRTLVRQYGIKEIRLLRRLESGAVLQSLRCEERKGEGKTVPGVHIQRHQPDSGLHPCDTAYLHEANRRRATERLFFRH